jgi:hypothetical protein
MLGINIKELEDLVSRLEVVANDMQEAAKVTDKASKRMIEASENYKDGRL